MEVGVVCLIGRSVVRRLLVGCLAVGTGGLYPRVGEGRDQIARRSLV